MPYEIFEIRDRPKSVSFLFVILYLSLKIEPLAEKYGFRFSKASDDMSEVEVCMIRTDDDDYFMILGREEFSEVPTHVFTTPPPAGIGWEDYAQKKIESFVRATQIAFDDLGPIPDFIDVSKLRAVDQ